jgi:hypothetical protein
MRNRDGVKTMTGGVKTRITWPQNRITCFTLANNMFCVLYNMFFIGISERVTSLSPCKGEMLRRCGIDLDVDAKQRVRWAMAKARKPPKSDVIETARLPERCPKGWCAPVVCEQGAEGVWRVKCPRCDWSAKYAIATKAA